jgi:perosamine synthetase
MQLPLSRPDVNDHDRSAVLEVLNSTVLSLGPKVLAFERAMAQRTRSQYAIAVNSGTSGLHLCVKAAGITDRDEVITSPFSFVASANCVLFERAKPVFVDIEAGTYNMAASRIESVITPRTRAILPVHVFGRPCALAEITYIARKYQLAVIEDACEAIGAQYQGKPVGTFGQTGVFAFYPNKQLTTGEGGMILTDDRSIAQRCRSWRNQGRSDTDSWLAHERLGYNYRLSDINCALGLSQLGRLDEILALRRRVAGFYDAALQDTPEVVRPPLEEPGSSISWFVYVVRLADHFDRADRDNVISSLRKEGIECRNYFTPIHLQPFYKAKFGFRNGEFPTTEHVAERTIALPFYNRLSESEVDCVCSSLRRAVASLRSRTVAVTR